MVFHATTRNKPYRRQRKEILHKNLKRKNYIAIIYSNKIFVKINYENTITALVIYTNGPY